MHINVCMNVKDVVMVSTIGVLGYLVCVKDAKIKKLTKDIEEMKKMKGV